MWRPVGGFSPGDAIVLSAVRGSEMCECERESDVWVTVNGRRQGRPYADIYIYLPWNGKVCGMEMMERESS